MILLSHANPEDNEVTLWLALQLAKEGYRVWCDLTKLLGGEVFWNDIEDALRSSAAKVVYVLSKTSNNKDGPLRELHLAQSLARRENLRDFVIPIKVDDLPYGDVTIELTRVNSTSFSDSWAFGLATLLKKLELDGVPKTASFNPSSVSDWWRSQFENESRVLDRPETLASNWLRVRELPPTLFEHRVVRDSPGPMETDSFRLTFPVVWNEFSGLTFATKEEFTEQLPSAFYIDASREISLTAFVAGADLLKEGPRFLSRLLRLAWEQKLGQTLSAYALADKRCAFYFKKNQVQNDTISFLNAAGDRTRRGIIGYKTLIRERLRYWHFAVSSRPIIRPETLFIISGHVIFSDDGFNIWENKPQLAKARRNQCKNWWNDDWRDRMYAVLSYLSDADKVIRLPLSPSLDLQLDATPILFESPVSYLEPGEVDKEAVLTDYEFEDDDDDDDASVEVQESNESKVD